MIYEEAKTTEADFGRPYNENQGFWRVSRFLSGFGRSWRTDFLGLALYLSETIVLRGEGLVTLCRARAGPVGAEIFLGGRIQGGGQSLDIGA